MQNTTSKYPTHFLEGIRLIEEARKNFNVPSENWTYPTKINYGFVAGDYYAEVWVDGMDWQSSYWLIERDSLVKPIVYPLLIFFEDDKNVNHFQSYELEKYCNAIMQFRMDENRLKHYTDSIWPYTTQVKNSKSKKAGDTNYSFQKYQFEHASQPKVEFLIIEELMIPKQYRGVRTKANTWGNGNITITTQQSFYLPNKES
jgi:hypothetical protein